jgi:hypothetical protein
MKLYEGLWNESTSVYVPEIISYNITVRKDDW